MQDYFETLLARLGAEDRALADTVNQLESRWTTGDDSDRSITQFVAQTILQCIEAGLFTFGGMAQGFRLFSDEYQQRQIEFLRTGKYREVDFEEVRKKVYGDYDYMMEIYYPSLLFSYLATPNYRQILRALEVTLKRWKSLDAANILDVASGHGFLLLYALRSLKSATGLAVDISKAGAQFARNLQDATRWRPDRVDYRLMDFLGHFPEQPHERVDACLCCELLEHVPNPGAFLTKIGEWLKPGGRLFITAAVRMESVDHLTLFRTLGEVDSLLDNSGFRVLERYSTPLVGSRPVSKEKWDRMLSNPQISATYIAECERC